MILTSFHQDQLPITTNAANVRFDLHLPIKIEIPTVALYFRYVLTGNDTTKTKTLKGLTHLSDTNLPFKP